MRCATCGTPLAFGSEVALAGLATNGGHCPQCQAQVRVRPPLVLVANAAAFVFLWLRFGPGASLPPQATYTSLPLAAIYTSLLLLILVTDLEHRLIFNAVIFPAIALAALASHWSAIGWRRGLARRHSRTGDCPGHLLPGQAVRAAPRAAHRRWCLWAGGCDPLHVHRADYRFPGRDEVRCSMASCSVAWARRHCWRITEWHTAGWHLTWCSPTDLFCASPGWLAMVWPV